MWQIILWTLGLSLAAWVYYNAKQNIRLKNRLADRARGEAVRRVPTAGEQMIAEWLKARGLEFQFDKPVARSLREPPFRPDFVLPGQTTFIEYYGLNDEDEAKRQRREELYRAGGWKVLSVKADDLDRLDEVLADGLGLERARHA
jgi:very-short-patch-repair endonuclease